MAPVMNITADQINCLVYAYLQDSGFQHTSFALRSEARLDLSPYAQTPIRRGELVDLLTKALLYTEVEAHWKADGNAADCSAPFSLITPHVCSTKREPVGSPAPALRPNAPRPELFPIRNGVSEPRDPVVAISAQKRKANAKDVIDTRSEKRMCSEDIEMQIDNPVVVSTSKTITERQNLTQKAQDDNMEQDAPILTNGTEDDLSIPPVLEDPKEAVILCQGHESDIFHAVWSPTDPDLLATASRDGTARLWEWQDIRANLRSRFLDGPEFPKPPYNSRYSRPHPSILRHIPKLEESDLIGVDWSPDGSLFATGGFDRLLRVWSKTGDLYMVQVHHQGPIYSVKFSADSKWLLSCGLDKMACVWNVQKKELNLEFKAAGGCLDIDWLDGTTFAVCTVNGAIQMVSLTHKQAIRTFLGHENSDINQIKFNKQRTMLASCSDDQTARIWRKESWTNADGSVVSPNDLHDSPVYPARFILTGHASIIGAIKWCPTPNDAEETILATCSMDSTVRLWDATKGTCLHIIDEVKRSLRPYALCFSPDGRFLVTCTDNGYLFIYNRATGRQLWRWPNTDPTTTPSTTGIIYDVNWRSGNRISFGTQAKLAGIVDTSKIPEVGP